MAVNALDHPWERLTAKAVWVGSAESVLLIGTALPALFSKPAFQVGRRFATLSIKGWRSALDNFRNPSCPSI